MVLHMHGTGVVWETREQKQNMTRVAWNESSQNICIYFLRHIQKLESCIQSGVNMAEAKGVFKYIGTLSVCVCVCGGGAEVSRWVLC